MSTSITTSNGLPEVWTARPSFQAKVSQMTVMFRQGEPLSLGIVQIFIGLLLMIYAMSAVLYSNMVAVNYIMGVMFVVSGSLAVAARKGTSARLIKGVLAVHVVSALVAVWCSYGMASHLYIMFKGWAWEPAPNILFAARYGPDPCGLGENNETFPETYSRYGRSEWCALVWEIRAVWAGVRGVLLLLCVLELCVSITVCVFSRKALRRAKHYSPHVVVVTKTDPLLDETLDPHSWYKFYLKEILEQEAAAYDRFDRRKLTCPDTEPLQKTAIGQSPA